MGRKFFRYKVTGTVKFSVDDLFAGNLEEARELFRDDPDGHLMYAKDHETYEILSVNAELLRPATKKEVFDIFGDED